MTYARTNLVRRHAACAKTLQPVIVYEARLAQRRHRRCRRALASRRGSAAAGCWRRGTPCRLVPCRARRGRADRCTRRLLRQVQAAQGHSEGVACKAAEAEPVAGVAEGAELHARQALRRAVQPRRRNLRMRHYVCVPHACNMWSHGWNALRCDTCVHRIWWLRDRLLCAGDTCRPIA